MMAKVMLRHALIVLLLAAGAVQAQEKFVAAGGAASAIGLYRVTLELFPGDDAGVVARQLAATYRGRLEMYAEEGFTGFAISMSESAARLLSTDTRVVRVEALGSEPAPAPPPVTQARPVAAPAPALAGIAGGAPVQSDATGSELIIGPYAYDGAGNVKSTGDGQPFVYDQFGRLKSGTVLPGRTESYTYDAFGNVMSMTTDGAVITMGVDSGSNRLTPSGTSNVHAQYDLAGNMISSAALGSFIYDGLGMVKESTTAGSRKLYIYTADEERIATITPAHDTWEYTVRGADQKVLRRITRTGSNWTWDKDYIYRAGTLLAAEVPGPEKTLHFHVDHLGTPRLITGNGGAEVSRHTYFAFGSEVDPAPPSAERMRFTGHERDSGNLDYMHARYYGVEWGRFLSVDPTWESADLTKPQSWNRYSYVMNNPVNMVDPDGRAATLVTAGIGALTGAGFQIGINLISGDDWDKDVVKEMAVGAGLGLTGVGLAKVVDKGYDTYRAAKVLQMANRAASALKGSTAAELMPQAMKTLTTTSANGATKAAMFEKMAAQITNLTKGGWTATRMAGTGGEHIFVGRAGEALVINSKGQLFRTTLKDGLKMAKDGKLEVLWDAVRAVK